MFNVFLGLPFSVAAWETKKGSLFASTVRKKSQKIGLGKFLTLLEKRVSGKRKAPEASRLEDGRKAAVQAAPGISHCPNHRDHPM
jgi:hypothetical protein